MLLLPGKILKGCVCYELPKPCMCMQAPESWAHHHCHSGSHRHTSSPGKSHCTECNHSEWDPDYGTRAPCVVPHLCEGLSSPHLPSAFLVVSVSCSCVAPRGSVCPPCFPLAHNSLCRMLFGIPWLSVCCLCNIPVALKHHVCHSSQTVTVFLPSWLLPCPRGYCLQAAIWCVTLLL